jgi:flavin reductase (DIM6/NTAB) family NADH-FMN oxidoreductase RutF
MTVNSFTSISLSPPLILVSLERSSKTYGLVKKAGFFGVSILSDGQQDISDCFAGRHTEKENRFSNISTHTLVTGAPFIDGGLAYFDCHTVDTYEAGTHTLFIAEVLAIELAEPEAAENKSHPLVYYNRSYRRLQP